MKFLLNVFLALIFLPLVAAVMWPSKTTGETKPKKPFAAAAAEMRSDSTSHSIKAPLMAWTPTIAPAGLDYYAHSAIPEWQNSLLLVTLKAQSLRVLKLNDSGDSVIGEKVYFEKSGRGSVIRARFVWPETSNGQESRRCKDKK
ncbi:MAG: PQQ-dependent sugar dehydrogenase [Cyclobacteriaceae bacterium]